MSQKKRARPLINGIRCPVCGIKNVRYRATSRDYVCNRCGTVFDKAQSVKKDG